MKKCVTIGLMLMITIGIHSQSISNAKKIESAYVKLTDSIRISKFELTNGEFRQFLSDNTSPQVKALSCDTMQWILKLMPAYTSPWASQYHWAPQYTNFPVVNISFKAVNQYCDWLTQQYNQLSGRQFKKVLIRLPTLEEWKLASACLPGSGFPWPEPYAYSHKKGKITHYYANFKWVDKTTDTINYHCDGAQVLASVNSYKPNQLGIYNLFGNVAEVTSKGVIKGGSWDNFYNEASIEKFQVYIMPDPRVGARLVMEILEK